VNNIAGANSVYEIMTALDWFGLSVMVTMFILTMVVYGYVFNPRTKSKLESHKFIIMNDDPSNKEVGDGRR